MSSHMFEEVEKTCSIVSIIKDGKIVAIDSINNLKKSKSKKYTISFENKNEVSKFQNEDLEILNIYEDKVTVIVQNNIKKLIKILSNYDITDITEEHQSLEDIFMGYYGGFSK